MIFRLRIIKTPKKSDIKVLGNNDSAIMGDLGNNDNNAKNCGNY